MLHSRFGPQKLMPWQGWSPKNWFKCLWRTIKTFIGLPLWWPSFCTSIILCTKAFHFLPLYLSLFPLTYFDVRKQQRKETEKINFSNHNWPNNNNNIQSSSLYWWFFSYQIKNYSKFSCLNLCLMAS